MNAKLTTLAVGLAAVVAAAGPASSGDWNNGAGGIKDGGFAGVPVPAPAPIPVYKADWYIRGDIGYAVSSDGRIESSGQNVGLFRDFSEVEGPLHFGLGVGRYLGQNLRAEFQLDFRPDQKIANKNPLTFRQTSRTVIGNIDIAPGVVAPLYRYETTDVERREDSRTGNQTALVNLYWDLFNRGGFTPYIGGGLGLVSTFTKRQYREDQTCFSRRDAYVDPGTGAEVSTPLTACNEITRVDGKASSVNYGLAAAFMAGAAYEVRPGTMIDVGYRYLWQGTEVDLTVDAGPGGFNRLKLEGRGDHEIRTGLRFDLN